MQPALSLTCATLLIVLLAACAAGGPAPAPTPTSEGETVQIIVIVQDTLAASVRGAAAPSAESRALLEAAPGLRPLEPTTTNPELARWFVAEVGAGEAATIVTRLQQTAGVESAYLKPADAAP